MNIIRNEEDFEIRKNIEDSRINSIPIRLESYLKKSKLGDLIELINLIIVTFLYFNFIYEQEYENSSLNMVFLYIRYYK